MKPYPSYKESEIEWIGQIPSGWVVSKLKYDTLIPVRYGMNISSDKYADDGIRFIRITDLTDWGELIKDNGKYLINEDVTDEFLLNKYDLLLCRSGHTVGKSYLHLEDGDYTSGGYLVRFNFGDYSKSKFIFYVSKTDFYLYWIQLNTVTSTIENVNGEKYSNMVYPKPPDTEKTQIVSFLDSKTQKIDELIEKTEKKIELLKEKRTALINEIVTGKKILKGDACVEPAETKDSGIEWVGEIPSGWRIVKLNHISSKMTNGYVGPTRGVMKESGVRYIQGIHIKQGEILFTPDGPYYVSEEWSNDHKKSKLKEGDVLVVQSGTIGEVGYVTREFEDCNCHALIIIRLKTEFGIGEYLKYFIMGNYVKNFFQTIKTGEILQHLNTTKVKYMKMCLPPLPEQNQIVEYLDEQTQKIDSTIEKETQRIELLKEYRQSLISEVVTGKVDVRGWDG